jgi:hypothetical protein
MIGSIVAGTQVGRAQPSGQGIVSINFGGSGSAMGAAEIAGVVPRSNWNNATGASRATPLVLVDEMGTATTATVTWTSDNTWSTPIADQAGNQRLMKGYIDTRYLGVTSITVAGLTAGGYDLYVYVDGDNPATRTGIYQISGPGITTSSKTLTDPANTNYNGTFVEANNSIGNYLRFSFNGTGFALTATPGASSDPNPRAPVNGLQIVPTTPPAPDFTLVGTPGSQSVLAGTSASYTITVGALNGFGGDVSFAVSGLPPGAAASFTPDTVAGAGSTTLEVTTAGTTPVGTSMLTITGTSGSLSRMVNVSLAVWVSTTVPPVVGLTQAEATTAVQNAGLTAAVTLQASETEALGVVLSHDPPAGSEVPTGTTVTLVVSSGLPQALEVANVQSTSSNAAGTTIDLPYTVPDVPGQPLLLVVYGGAEDDVGSRTLPAGATFNGRALTLAGAIRTPGSGYGAGAGMFWTVAQPNESGTIRLTFTDTCNERAIGAVTLIGADPSGPAAVETATATGSLTDQITTTTPNALVVSAATQGNATALTPSGSGHVLDTSQALASSRVAGGHAAVATPATVTLGYSGSINRIAQVLAAFRPGGPPSPDFALAATPASRMMDPGESGTYTVDIGALNGFSGTVDLSISGLPPGMTAAFDPAALGGSGSATLTVTAGASQPPGSATLTITGTSGALSRTTTVGATVTGEAGAISINFVGNGTSMSAAETAGVVPKPYWNNATGASRTAPLALIDESGTATTASLTWSSNTTGSTGISDLAGNNRFMKGYLYTTSSGAATVTITGLSAGTYDVYVYSDGNNGSNTRTSAYQISGAGIPAASTNLTDAASTNFAGTFVQANNSSGNYVKFRITGSGFTVTATPGQSSNSIRRAQVNGLQIVPVVPGTFTVSGTISPSALGAGASLALGGDAVGMVTANGSGQYSFSGLSAGSYVVTPGKPGYTFAPPARNVSIVNSSLTGIDFTASAAPVPDFTLSASPSAQAGVRGGTTTYTVNVGALNGFGGTVSLNVSGLPAGASASFTPPSVTGGGASTLAVTTSAGTPLATSTLTITGTSGALSHTTTVTLTVTGSSGVPLTVNGAQTFQTIDGLGVNANSLSWKNGELQPGLDLLIDQMGASAFRVVFDMEDWEDPNDNNDPNTPNWTYYNALYSNAKFQNLWSTLRYLNQKGITGGITLSLMGRVPPWMGGSVINASREDEWVEMIATLLFYARNTVQAQFNLVDPLNEPDFDGIEGPFVDADQYTLLLAKLAQRLDAMGLGDFRFVGPNTAYVTLGVAEYIPHMMESSVVMSKVDHFGLHNYEGTSGGADAAIKSSPYPTRNFWMTEIGTAADVLTLIGENAAGIHLWEGYDSVYNHAILAGRGTTAPNDSCCGVTGMLAYNNTTGVYTPRKIFYELAQIFRFVPPGAVRIAATESNANLTVYGFFHASSGRMTLVGRNTGGSAVTVNGALSSLPAATSFAFYWTDATTNFLRGSDVAVSAGTFSFVAPANSYFTLTSAAGP